ncbi:hypothetical protein HII13_000799 [Brettanomyces bruxellensis]|nr:hypothetical protein HII13_000799 [Brettanomyces bruxellensis]
MQEELEKGIISLDINDTASDIDITDTFQEVIGEIDYGTVVKSQQFKLLHGTHALEVMNPKLDTSLLPTIQFDLCSVNSIEKVNSIIVGIFDALCAWLDNNSLSVSVFSCAYIERLLVNYRQCGVSGLDFHTHSGNKQEHEKQENSISDILQSNDESIILKDAILRTFCVSILQFVKFVIKMGLAGVIYEEEDLNTQTMNMNIIQEVDLDRSVLELSRVMTWVQTQTTEKNPKSADFQFCYDSLKLVNCMLEIPKVLNLNLEPYSNIKNEKSNSSSKLHEIRKNVTECLSIIKKLSSLTSYVEGLPDIQGCFSTNVQKHLDNCSPPKPVVLLKFDDTMQNLDRLITDSLAVLRLVDVEDSVQMVEYLSYLMNKRESTDDEDDILGMHVVARSVLQLFLIRDDESIFGSKNYNISSLLTDFMTKIATQNAKIFDINKKEVQVAMGELLSNIKFPFYNFLTCVSQNPARQRQICGREIILWDRFQVDAENLELKFNNLFPDNFDGASFPIMPIASFIYYSKLKKMIQLVLKNVELHLYKDLRELNVGYWGVSYLIDYLLQHLNRLIDLVKLRQKQVNILYASLGKARGKKKEELMKLYKKKSAPVPDLIRTQRYLEYQVSKFSILRGIIEVKLVELQILNYFGYLKLPRMCKVPEQMLFEIQFKPIQSVGVPEMPSFDDYQKTLNRFNDAFKEVLRQNDFGYFKKLITVKAHNLNDYFHSIEKQLKELGFPSFLSDIISSDIKNLRRASIYAELSINKLIRILGDNSENHKNLNISIERLHQNPYFPNIQVELVKQTSDAHKTN